jgi:hypothetical protein
MMNEDKLDPKIHFERNESSYKLKLEFFNETLDAMKGENHIKKVCQLFQLMLYDAMWSLCLDNMSEDATSEDIEKFNHSFIETLIKSILMAANDRRKNHIIEDCPDCKKEQMKRCH